MHSRIYLLSYLHILLLTRVLAFSVIHLDHAYCNAPMFLQLVCNRCTINVWWWRWQWGSCTVPPAFFCDTVTQSLHLYNNYKIAAHAFAPLALSAARCEW